MVGALGPDALVFVSMLGIEALGRPFDYAIGLASEDANLALGDLLGNPLGVRLELSDGEYRYFHRVTTEVDITETRGSTAIYRARVRPWLALLENTTNCRISQNKKFRLF
jgi:type VI secretion system secreted protein VgrG